MLRDGRIASVAGAVLAAGSGPERMALARLLDGLFDEVLLVGGEPLPDAPGRRVPDAEGPACALRGLLGALEAATRPRVLVASSALPRPTPDLLLALLAWPEADAVVPTTAVGPQPLCAIYSRDAVAPLARAELAEERPSLAALLARVTTAALGPHDVARIDAGWSARVDAR